MLAPVDIDQLPVSGVAAVSVVDRRA